MLTADRKFTVTVNFPKIDCIRNLNKKLFKLNKLFENIDGNLIIVVTFQMTGVTKVTVSGSVVH